MTVLHECAKYNLLDMMNHDYSFANNVVHVFQHFDEFCTCPFIALGQLNY